MKNTTVCLAVLAALPMAVFGASPAATESWVKNYVATNTVEGTIHRTYADGVLTYTLENNGETLVMTGELPTELGLVVSNCSAGAIAVGITNGTKFAYSGIGGQFYNSTLNQTITAAASNLVYEGVSSAVVDGVDNISGWFDVRSCKLTKSEASVLVGHDVAWANPSLLERVIAFIVPSARADQWEGQNFYTPKVSEPPNQIDLQFIQDGEVYTIETTEDGPPQVKPERPRIKVDSVFDICLQMQVQMFQMVNLYASMDKEIDAMDDRLNAAFMKVMSEIETIKTEQTTPTSSGTKTETVAHPVLNTSSSGLTLGGFVTALLPDKKSIGVSDGDKYQIYGWNYKTNCDENLSDLLKTGANTHDFVTRLSDGTLHYLPLGSGLTGGGAEVDGVSITTNAASGAVTEGVASLFGFGSASDYSIPHKQGSSIEWLGLDQFLGDSLEYANEAANVKGYNANEALPRKYVGTSNGGDFGWYELPADFSAIKFTGTDGNSITIGSGSATNEVTFAAETDSNVSVKCTRTDANHVTVKIGVYWK